jgi:uncharacterized protein (TIGR00730 family)
VRRLCVFCGSSTGRDPGHERAARSMGEALVERGLGLVYGGGGIGLMGIVADTVLSDGGEVTGVIPEPLMQREIGHLEVTDLRIVGSMHERKKTMADLSDGFVALPGGLGTLEELLEALTWAQLGIHFKPCGVVNVAGYFDSLLELLDHGVDEGFIRPEYRRLLLAAGDPVTLLDRFEHYEPPPLTRWLERDET